MTTKRPTTSFKFRGGTFHALVVKPEAPLDAWLAEIDKLLNRSKGFFAGKSVVVDVSGLELTKDGFLGLLDELSQREIRVLGVEGADPACNDGRIPSLTCGKSAETKNGAKGPARETATSEPAPASSILIDAPVRSGQQVVHPHGDVTVIGSVASGAEIIAAGSVHVYGALRGRVLAGAYGNDSARIFCRRLEAELIAIDGHCVMADDIEPHLREACIQAWLDKDALEITTMD